MIRYYQTIKIQHYGTMILIFNGFC